MRTLRIFVRSLCGARARLSVRGGSRARGAHRLGRPLRPHVERFANRVVLGRVGPTVIVTYGAFAGIGTAVSLGSCHALLGGSIPAGTEAAYLALIAL